MRFFKRWYFKLYHLLKFLGIFIILITPNIVKAEEYNTCFDSYKVGNVSLVSSGFGYMNRIRPSLIVNANKTYYVKFFPTGEYSCKNNNCFWPNYTNIWDKDAKSLGTITLSNFNYDINNNILSFKTPDNSNIYYLGLNIRVDSGYTLHNVIVDTPIIISENKDDLLSCPTTPEPEPTGNTKLDDFMSIYVDRLTYLSEKTIENQYMLAFIGVIFGFIVLELTLHILHIRGGYKK